MILFFLNNPYAYSLRIEIKDSTTFFSLPSKTGDTIALYLYNHVVDRNPELQRIVIGFSYIERIYERASYWTLTNRRVCSPWQKACEIKNTI